MSAPSNDQRRAWPLPERVRQLLRYDPVAGTFTWRIGRPGHSAGVRAGCLARVDSGTRLAIVIGIDGQRFYANRVAWVLMTGAWPAEAVEFRDRDPLNLRWDNLFSASQLGNQRLQRSCSTEAAGQAYQEAKRQLHTVGGVAAQLPNAESLPPGRRGA